MRYFRFSVRSQPEIQAASASADLIVSLKDRVIERRKNTIEFIMNSNANQWLCTEGKTIPFLHHYVAVVFPDREYALHLCDEERGSTKSTAYSVAVEIPDLEYTWFDADDEDSLRAFLREKESKKSIILPQIMRPDDKQYQKIAMLMRSLVNHCFKQTVSERLRCLATWYELVALLDLYVRSEIEYIYYSDEFKKPTTDYYTYKAKKYIADHYPERVTVPIIAQSLGISPNYLSALFKDGTGATVINYLNFYRVQRIREALCHDGQQDVGEICARVGISDERYARRLFKKYFGVSIQRCLQMERGITLPYNPSSEEDTQSH